MTQQWQQSGRQQTHQTAAAAAAAAVAATAPYSSSRGMGMLSWRNVRLQILMLQLLLCLGVAYACVCTTTRRVCMRPCQMCTARPGPCWHHHHLLWTHPRKVRDCAGPCWAMLRHAGPCWFPLSHSQALSQATVVNAIDMCSTEAS
jgi:hypothetical protein